jgi:hypothetical protein
MLRCDKHRVALRKVREGGKLVWRCPFSHTKRYEDHSPSRFHCNKCGANYPTNGYHRC